MASRDEFSKALRVIGQILETQGIDLFDLKCSGEQFYLQCGDPVPPHLSLVEIRYSTDQINALDQAARRNRQRSIPFVNFDGLPEILRAIGRRFDVSNGRLLSVSNSESSTPFESIKIEYQIRGGIRHSEEFFTGTLREQAMRMYKERSRRVDGAVLE